MTDLLQRIAKLNLNIANASLEYVSYHTGTMMEVTQKGKPRF